MLTLSDLTSTEYFNGKHPQLDEALSTRIKEAVSNQFGDQIEFTKELVRHPSVPGQEHTCRLYLRELKERGYAMDRWAINPATVNPIWVSPVAVDYDNAVNVVGTHRPKTNWPLFGVSRGRCAGWSTRYVGTPTLRAA